MSVEFLSRLVGMVVFVLVGGRLGSEIAITFRLPEETLTFFFALIGVLFGLIVTPLITIRPLRTLNRMIQEASAEVIVATLVGLLSGLVVGLLLAYPLSLVSGENFGNLLPVGISLLAAYLGATIAVARYRDIWDLLGGSGMGRRALSSIRSSRQLLLDTSVLIDGRIVGIAKTGFLGGTLLVPRFVLNELHQVADSSDPLRRNRGRHGLAKLNELQRNAITTVKVIDDDVEDVSDVDAKLVALSLQMDAPLVTNDFNLNRVAEAQGVFVLNINSLANAVRSVYIPGETFPIHIIQEGRELGQGVGYLEDGTMVVVENGRTYIDRTIRVTVTKLITKDTGRMIFAVPESNGGAAVPVANTSVPPVRR